MVSQARLFAAFALVAIATAVSVDHQVVELGTAVPGITCPAGSLKTTANGNSATCTACDAGKSVAAGGEVCANCDAGKYAIAGAVCSPCKAGESSIAGAVCTACDAGKSSTAGTACTACDAGKFAAAGATQCCATLDKGLAANPGARSRTNATPCSHLCNECRFYRKGNVPSQLCINWVKRNENKKGMANFVAWTAKTADDAKCGK